MADENPISDTSLIAGVVARQLMTFLAGALGAIGYNTPEKKEQVYAIVLAGVIWLISAVMSWLKARKLRNSPSPSP